MLNYSVAELRIFLIFPNPFLISIPLSIPLSIPFFISIPFSGCKGIAYLEFVQYLEIVIFTFFILRSWYQIDRLKFPYPNK